MVLYKTVPIRRIAHINNGGTPTADVVNWGGAIPWATPRDLGRVHGGYIDSTDRTITEAGASNGAPVVPQGSVILSTRAPVGYVAIATEKMAFNQGCRALVPRTSAVSSQYLSYALQSTTEILKAAAQGTTFLELNGTSLAESPVPFPPQDRQQLIVEFLDRETAEIDAFVADQERLIELLEERRAATITHAVTKGLDPNAPMKDSGIRWIRETPTDWTVVPLRRVASVVNGGTPTQDETNWGGSILWATPVDLNHFDGSTIHSTGRTLTDLGLLTASSTVPAGSILLSTRAPVGYVARTISSIAFNQGCKGVIPRKEYLSARFMTYALIAARNELNARAQGTTS